MPVFQAVLWINIVYLLLPLRPSHPSRLRVLHKADHLIRDRQFGINGRSKRMNELWPMVIPQPKHGAAIGTEIPLRRTDLLIWCASRHDSGIFPKPVSPNCHPSTPIEYSIADKTLRVISRQTWLTWSSPFPSWSSGCRQYHPDWRCHCTRLPSGRCYRRIVDRELELTIRVWTQRCHTGSCPQVSCILY